MEGRLRKFIGNAVSYNWQRRNAAESESGDDGKASPVGLQHKG